jgi:hypothetical protein
MPMLYGSTRGTCLEDAVYVPHHSIFLGFSSLIFCTIFDATIPRMLHVFEHFGMQHASVSNERNVKIYSGQVSGSGL